MKAFQTISTNSEVGKHVKAFEIEDYIPLCVISVQRIIQGGTLLDLAQKSKYS